jgi:AcrR family transcriptional regulator
MFDSTNVDNRKQDFLRTALDLFYEKGYESTKITDICKEMDVTKGAFYYYFESKEDILVAIAEAFTEKSVDIIRSIINQPGTSVLEKINKMFISINRLKFKERDWRTKFKRAVKSEENLKLQNRIASSLKLSSISMLKELIDAGAREGEFGDIVNSDEMAEFLINTILSLNIAVDDLENELYKTENDNQECISKIEQKVHFYGVMLDRAFQVREGSFDLRTPYMIKISGEG